MSVYITIHCVKISRIENYSYTIALLRPCIIFLHFAQYYESSFIHYNLPLDDGPRIQA